MNEFKVFDLLPNGIIVFKNAKVEYISKHILDVLNIAYLNKKNAIKIIYKTIGLSSKDDLLNYFIQHEYFTHKNKIIQIEHSKHDKLDIFSFVLINKSLLDLDSDIEVSEPIISNTDKKVTAFFKKNNFKKIKVLTFFRGLPLKNFAKILRVTDDSIEIVVDSKHLISLKEKDEILLIFNEKKGSTIIKGQIIDNDKNVLTVQNFSLSKSNAHLREGIRIKNYDELIISIGSKKFKIYDISKRGISIFVKDKDEKSFIKKHRASKLLLNGELLKVDIEYLKTIYQNDKILKVIFNTSAGDKVNSKINDYLISKQNAIIREIHEYLKQL